MIYKYLQYYEIKSSQTLVDEALKEIKTISTDEAYKIVSNNNQCNLIDIRDIRELTKRRNK